MCLHEKRLLSREALTAGLCLALVSAAASVHAGLPAAWQDVGYLDYRRATPQFERLREGAAQGSAAWQQATLGLALCLHQRQPDTKADKERAAELYDALIVASDKAPIQATALLLRGKVDQLVDYFGDKEDFAGAAGFYGRILRDWRGMSARGMRPCHPAVRSGPMHRRRHLCK